MPVTFKVASHTASVMQPQLPADYKPQPPNILQATWGRQSKKSKCVELLQSTFSQPSIRDDLPSIQPRENGFVHTILSAYSKHHHLTLKPDDVWIAILSQFNFFVNAHAEELRSHFVAHEGKKELMVITPGNRYSVDFRYLMDQMTKKIQENVVDSELKDWILPNFTTTTENDTITSAALMMSTLKSYFEYKVMMLCGIPSVTLEGEKEDWESLLARIDKLPTFGDEPTKWANLLRPILTRFVAAFDGNPDTDFWKRVCHVQPEGSGSDTLSGWITAFCVWTEHGRWQGDFKDRQGTILDGVKYPCVDEVYVPQGFAEVDVKLDDHGEELPCKLVAGHIASQTIGKFGDGLRPYPGWFFFVREDLEASSK